MIEVRKYIPQIYNQSRDFSVFMGIMQIALNELDLKSRVLELIPSENVLPYDLVEFPSLKSDFRGMLKNKGSISCLLYAITAAGGLPVSFDEENQYLDRLFYLDGREEVKVDYLDRCLTPIPLNSELDK